MCVVSYHDMEVLIYSDGLQYVFKKPRLSYIALSCFIQVSCVHNCVRDILDNDEKYARLFGELQLNKQDGNNFD